MGAKAPVQVAWLRVHDGGKDKQKKEMEGFLSNPAKGDLVAGLIKSSRWLSSGYATRVQYRAVRSGRMVKCVVAFNYSVHLASNYSQSVDYFEGMVN